MWCYTNCMAPHFENQRKYIQILNKYGWTPADISTYLPKIEALGDLELLELHTLCNISMFNSGEPVDRDQAIFVLINPKDTEKELLFSSLDKLSRNNETL